MEGLTLADLRGDMQDLGVLLGIDTVLMLCSLFGGDNIYIPLGDDEGTEDIEELKMVLGHENYQRIKHRYRGSILYFPKQETLLKDYTSKKVRSEYDGNNRRQLMRKYHLTKNSFYRIIDNDGKNSLEKNQDDGQMSIFDFI